MSETRIVTTPAVGYRRLGVHGQVVVDAYRQVFAVLKNRIGPGPARFLARPQPDPATAALDWYAAGGKAVPLGQLPPDEQQRLLATAGQLRREIAQLADALKREGAAAELIGKILDLVIVTPEGDDWLYAVDGKPVMVLWGHERETVVAAPPPAALPPPPRPAPAAPAAMIAANAAPKRAWWAWLLPLLLALLLLALALRACRELEPEYVNIPGPAPELADPVPEAARRTDDLRAQLEALKQQRRQFAERCVPEEPTPPQRAELPALPPLPAPQMPLPAPQTQLPPPAKPPAQQPRPAAPPTSTPATPPQATAPQATAPAEPAVPCRPPPRPGDEPEVVLVVDSSGSMREPYLGARSRMDLAKDAAENMVRGLPSGVDVGLIEFTSCTQVRRDRFYSSSERDQLIGEVRRLNPWQGTPLARSIERAGNVVSSSADGIIVIVSDGMETCGGDPCAEARRLKQRNPKVRINIVDISGDARRSDLQCIANASGGKVFRPASVADMQRSVQQASEQPDTRQCGGN